MSEGWIFAFGFAAQALFSARLLVQWIKSEKVRRVLTPRIFWELSIAASFLMFIYGWLRDDFAIMLGQTITYFIYIRNLHLQDRWRSLPKSFRLFMIAFPIVAILYGFNNGRVDTIRLFENREIPLWLLVWGSVAQIVFTLRFVYQWLRSEQKRVSHLPLGFWLLSLGGSSMIIVYAIFRKDPVLFVGQIFGFVVYVRNTVFSIRAFREKRMMNA